MSKRDPRFKPLKWASVRYEPNTCYMAAGLSTVYHIVTIGNVHQLLGCNDPAKNAQYFYLSDAYAVAQLDHETRLKEWMA